MTIPTGSTAITDPTDPTHQASVDSTGALKVAATFSAASVAIQDGTTASQKLAVDSNGKIGISSMPAVTATAAKQPALGTAGSASSDVLTVQGIASMTALKTDGSAVTQPVSGTITANAGTNLNTSALALETGGNLATLAGAISSSKMQASIAAIASALSQSNQIPVSNAAPQGKLTISGTLTANSDNSLTFSGGATVARRIRIQNESSGVIYWETDATASAGSPSLAAPAANAVSAEWVAVQCTTLHIFIPSGGTTTLNGSGGVKVTAYA